MRGFCILSVGVAALLTPLGRRCASSKRRKVSAGGVGHVPQPGEKEPVKGKETGTQSLLLLKNQGEKGRVVHDIKAPSTDSHLD